MSTKRRYANRMRTTKTARLSDDELDAWRGFRRMGELISSLVAQQITVVTGLSSADFAVLSQLRAAGGGKRQKEMQMFLGWDKSRLSHQLARMEARSLISKSQQGPNGPEVRITREGRMKLEEALPTHAAEVRRYFIDPLSKEDIAAIRIVADKLRKTVG
jgi:DNA-binding MarR family transcriptional regulator